MLKVELWTVRFVSEAVSFQLVPPHPQLLRLLLQVLPVSAATREVRRTRGYAANELVFEARAPPLGFTTYSVSLLEGGAPPPAVRRRAPPSIQNQVKLNSKQDSACPPVLTNPSVCSSYA